MDIGARETIHRLIADLAREGVAVLLISSDLPELLQLSHRLLVLHKGRLAGALTREEATATRSSQPPRPGVCSEALSSGVQLIALTAVVAAVGAVFTALSPRFLSWLTSPTSSSRRRAWR